MKLILIRHGETEENEAGIHQGWLPGKLTEKGIYQAKKLAERLKNIPINIVYTSNLQRCLDTTKEITKLKPNLKVITEKLIRERNKGEWNGKHKDEIDWNTIPGEKFNQKPPGGESLQEALERMKKFHQNLLKKHQNDTVLVVSHGGVLSLYRSFLLNQDIENCFQQKIPNTGLTELEIDHEGNVKVLTLNCNKHL
ncbi:MAG: histidine phosphatase family protein [Nanoarchaeota archaeon]|nr:histidine phosphatase family protein [Nanoarchaeota archaeon]MBU1623294.1 histidine phosphatase family protein [Nanoarchaeota archaeon]MBU1974070.1 histidine phosphatase family protein [Nanoarchaeota archaeon]